MANANEKKYLDYNGLVEVFGIVKKEIEGVNNTIDGLNYGGVTTGTVITQVTQTKGKVSAESANITSVDETITVNGLDLSVNIDGKTIIQDSKKKLAVSPAATAVDGENAIVVTTNAEGKKVSLKIDSDEKVLSQDEEGLKSTITITKETAGLESNVKEQYKLVGKDGVVLGETIKIYKDSSLQNVELNDQTLVFTYILADGSTKTQDVDISLFLSEEEYEDGLQVVGGKVSVKKASNSEGFLVVDKNGVAITGVQSAIDTAKAAAISELKGEVSEEGDTLEKLEDRLETVEGLVGETSVATQIQTAINALDAEVTSTDGTFVTVKVTEVDGEITAVNVTETDIASATALTTEITARKAVDGQNGQTYEANSGTNYISGATSLNGADVLLDTAIKAVADAAISVSAGNGITISESGTTKTITATAKSDDKYIEVTEGGIASKGIDTAIETECNTLWQKITALDEADITAAWGAATSGD